jgi:PIN domain nuclease of toxin-antitoxin system
MLAEREGQCMVDASALLALLLKEPGAEVVLDHIRHSPGIITLVNFCGSIA